MHTIIHAVVGLALSLVVADALVAGKTATGTPPLVTDNTAITVAALSVFAVFLAQIGNFILGAVTARRAATLADQLAEQNVAAAAQKKEIASISLNVDGNLSAVKEELAQMRTQQAATHDDLITVVARLVEVGQTRQGIKDAAAEGASPSKADLLTAAADVAAVIAAEPGPTDALREIVDRAQGAPLSSESVT